MHRHRDCAERENHIGSQFGPGIAALAVLSSSHVFQVIPNIVGIMPGVLGHRLTGCQGQ